MSRSALEMAWGRRVYLGHRSSVDGKVWSWGREAASATGGTPHTHTQWDGTKCLGIDQTSFQGP